MKDDRPIVKFDTETKCKLDLSDVGRHRYLSHPTADLLMFGYKLGAAPTNLWIPGMPVPVFFRTPHLFRFAAFNAQFDWKVINQFRKRYGFGEFKLEQMIDIMAVAARYGLPQSLDKLGMTLKVKMQKMSEGKTLKKVCCTVPQTCTNEQWATFKKYCIRDVDSMSEIMMKMPGDHLSDNEQQIWVRNAHVNEHGLPIDTWSVKQINKVVDYYTASQAKRVPFITGQAIQTIGQRDKIIKWCGSKGVKLDNYQILTVDAAVKDLDQKLLDPFEDQVVVADYTAVRTLLHIKQLIGGTAVKKFKKLKNLVSGGFIHDNLRYHGAGTGRVTGGGFQMLNLPRAKVKPDKGTGQSYDSAVKEVLKTFFDVSVLKQADPLLQAKKLVRPMIRAIKGKALLVADWSSIEYILLMYFAGEWEKVDLFRHGKDPYITFATELFHVAYDDVSDEQRQESKPPVLGSGYMLGSGVPRRDPAGGLIGYALGYGVEMTDAQAEFATKTYRNGHPMVVASWYALKTAAHDAIDHPDIEFKAKINGEEWKNTQDHDLKTSLIVIRDRTGRPWLVMTLPSGRKLFYCQPQLVPGKYGKVIKHMGVNPYTKQWSPVFLKPQRMIENVIQGLGRDILEEAKPRLDDAEFTRIFDVYDEIGCHEDEEGSRHRLLEMTQLMCIPPKWMPNLPLKAEGYVSRRYMKG